MSRTSTCILLAILLIYAISISVRLFFPVEEKAFLNQNDENLEWNGKSIPFSYIEYGSKKEGSTLVIVTDPFNRVGLFEPFSMSIAEHQRVIIPIFPTADNNGNKISHSPKERAEILSRFLEINQLEEIDLAGHGFGNSIAIELLDQNISERVRSYGMLSSLGVQEFHFLGYHVLNQPIYSMLYPLGWLVDFGLPIANWNRSIPIGMEGARFLNEIDQRPYRDILSNIEIPVHILHSLGDNQVSVNTAIEHHRMIPQSSLEITDGGHSAIQEKAGVWSESYLEFLKNVESKNATVYNNASTERVRLAEQGFKFGDVPPVDGWAFFMVVLLLTVVTLISEDLGCIGAGLLAAGNVITIWAAFWVIFLGILLADVGIYWMGRKLGRPVIQNAPFKWLITRRDIDWTAAMFRNNGFKIMIGSRFLPGTRFPTYFSSGVLQTKFPAFFVYFLISILIWIPIIMGASILIGQQMIEYLQIYQEYAVHIFFGLVIVLYLSFKFLIPLSTKKGRRELAVQVIRLKQRLLKN